MIVKRINDNRKKYKVVVNGKVIKFGAKGYRIKVGTKAGDNYCARSLAIKGSNNPYKANYWARRVWGCVGKKSLKSKAIKPI